VEIGRARPAGDDVPLERRHPGHEPAEGGEELGPLQPHGGADQGHADDLDEDVEHDHDGQVERMAPARPGQLHPAEHRERHDRGPAAELLGIRQRRHRGRPVDQIAGQTQRAHEVPHRAEHGRDQPESDPEVDPHEHGGRVRGELRGAEEPCDDDLDEKQEAADLDGTDEAARAGHVQVGAQAPSDARVGHSGRGHRRGHGGRPGEHVKPHRDR
jgi:hypothetical protein